ncbi:hypothetical protein ACI2LM_25820 [Paenibacillus lautus]|uniref:hypothetical protein n=1 Tax=Paenibacillus lautus TaxID=1401 RepID=UPI0010E93620|nr:Uncharacterised protein [Actinobacillus pleuropneumoniae]
MKDFITLKQLSDIDEAVLLDQAFSTHFPWYKQGEYFIRCLEENREGKRITIMAFYGNSLAG